MKYNSKIPGLKYTAIEWQTIESSDGVWLVTSACDGTAHLYRCGVLQDTFVDVADAIVHVHLLEKPDARQNFDSEIQLTSTEALV